jgi:signal transduction histidine kinase
MKRIAYKKKLFTWFLLIFVAFATILTVFEQKHEEAEKQKSLENILDSYSEIIHSYILENELSYENIGNLSNIIPLFPENLRITMIDGNGKVMYDNDMQNIDLALNHLDRPEIQKAKHQNTGSDIRNSVTLHQDFYYYAKNMDNQYFIRVALPYDAIVKKNLKTDKLFIYFALAVFLIGFLLLNYVANRFSKSITQLREFARKAKNGDKLPENADFQDDELGEIGREIRRIFENSEQNRKLFSIESSKNQKIRQELTSSIAHELRTPVTALRAYLETLAGQRLSPKKQQQFISRSYSLILRLSELINDISLITKMQEATDRFPKENLNIPELLKEVVFDLGKNLQANETEVSVQISENTRMKGNYTLIYAIFRNLIENSCNYAGKGVKIRINNFREDEDFLYFSFADNGKGVEEQHLNRLFERFYRVDDGRGRDSGGSGLGLSIVKNAVLLHNGEINIRNQPEGGLEFLFTLKK